MCTIFAKREKEGLIIGRSFDWVQLGGNVMFVPSYRSYGINTIGSCFLEQLGEDRPYEGMNENGLLVAVVAVPTKGEDKRDLKPLYINAQGMVRCILERASTVDEALYIVKQFKIDYDIKYGVPKVQYFFADINNKVGIYEEDVYEENVTLDIGDYRLLTNKSVNNSLSCSRYKKIKNILDKNQKVDKDNCMDIVSQAEQDGLTAWTCVYIPKKRSFSLCIDQNSDDKFNFNIKKCLKKGRYSIDFAELKLNARVMNRKRNNAFIELDTY